MPAAKLILLSSGVTILVLLGGLYSAREYLIEYLRTELALETPASLPPREPEGTVIPDVVAQANDAVVSIVVSKDVPIYERYFEPLDPFGWFGMVPRLRQEGTERQDVGGGSGFVASPEGLIVTNRHVVADDDATYQVVLADGTAYEAIVKARDPILDIAVLALASQPETPLPYLPFASSSTVRLGETVIAIGNALAEFNNSVSVGVVSGIGRNITASDGRGQFEDLNQVIQTDAAINPGNSGGPLLNIRGEVVGVNVATSLGADNISFALPANVVAPIVASVSQYGEIRRPYLGVRYTMITPRLVAANNLSVDYGALVGRGELPEELAVIPGSPAARAGVVENDIIQKIGATELREVDLATELRKYAIGDSVTLTIWRNGEVITVTTVLEQAPTE